ncbi:MAG TPA: hypothetical protein VGG11_19210, partial [Xanthobacteraceae bacterium]
AEWRAEFERDGERLVYDNIMAANYTDVRKRRAAFSWLTDETSRRRARMFRALEVAMWMLISVFALIIIGAVAILLTLTERALGGWAAN